MTSTVRAAGLRRPAISAILATFRRCSGGCRYCQHRPRSNRRYAKTAPQNSAASEPAAPSGSRPRRTRRTGVMFRGDTHGI
eukprot:scaffold82660_cov35-Phaeocystis_antarctica.AAC.1